VQDDRANRKYRKISGDSGSGERELGVGVRFRDDLAVRTAGAAGLGAGAQGLVDDGLDGARASATFGAAAEATVDLLGIAGKVRRSVDGAADILVADDVTGTNNHENGRPIGDA
jgi:hypothetical protein